MFLNNSVLLLLVIMFFGCTNYTQSTDKEITKSSGVITLSKKQIASMGIKWRRPDKQKMVIQCESKGIVVIAPQNKTTISIPIGGIVKSIFISEGDYVKKGAIIADLEHPDFIKVQQEYLENYSRYEYLKNDYARQGELTLEHATSIKKMQQAQAEFNVLEAKVFSLRKILELLGIDYSVLKASTISSTIKLLAPESGYIANLKANPGEYLVPGGKICEIIDYRNLLLKLNIPHKELPTIQIGQRIKFSGISQPEISYFATISAITKVFDPKNQSVLGVAKVQSQSSCLIPEMEVKAIFRSYTHNVYALPKGSIIKSGDRSFIYIFENGRFFKIAIKIGLEGKNLVEIENNDSNYLKQNIVVEGAYLLDKLQHKLPN